MSTTVYLAPTAGCLYQAFASTGLPLNAGLLATYAAGSTTPTATYTTSAGTVQNANPIVLGADGRTPSEVWLLAGTAYRFDLKDSAGNLIQTYDNLYGIGDPGAANQPSPVFGLTGAAGTNTITANASAALTALAVNQLFVLTPAATNTTGVTLNITGATNMGAKNVFNNGAALLGGELIISVPTLLQYDGTQFNVVGDVPASGTFTGTLTGGTTSPTMTIYYTKIGKLVSLSMPLDLTATSNTTAKTITGMPAAIRPVRAQYTGGFTCVDNSGPPAMSYGNVGTGGVITVQPSPLTSSWTNSGTALIGAFNITYSTA